MLNVGETSLGTIKIDNFNFRRMNVLDTIGLLLDSGYTISSYVVRVYGRTLVKVCTINRMEKRRLVSVATRVQLTITSVGGQFTISGSLLKFPRVYITISGREIAPSFVVTVSQ